jgi:hypothetical protein
VASRAVAVGLWHGPRNGLQAEVVVTVTAAG